MSESTDSSTGPESSGGLSAGDAGAARGELALQLRGGLPCVRCGYNLGGLSIRGVCPECGTPIRATLLVVVDPHAKELQPVPRAGLVVAGLLAWALGALAAALLGWWISVAPFAGSLPGWEWSAQWARGAAVVCLVMSGVGALALVRPHGRIPWGQRLAAAGGALGLLGLAALSWWTWGRYFGSTPVPAIAGRAPPVEATLVLMAQAALAALVIVCLRPNARLLEARSLLLRSGRVDRQTMYAMAAAVGVVVAGHGVNLGATLLQGRPLEVALSAGTILVAVGWMLVTIGLVGVLLDVSRLCPVLLEPSPNLGSLLAGGAVEAGDGR